MKGLVKKVRKRREGVTSGLLRQDTDIRVVAVQVQEGFGTLAAGLISYGGTMLT